MISRHSFERKLQSDWPSPYWEDVSTLVAVSGGPDSVALLIALASIHPQPARNLLVAHFNHGTRGNESDADERFVGQLATDLGIPFVSKKSTCSEPGTTQVSEMELRRWRYAFLEATAKGHGARYIATGHTSDDQVETILHRIIRGTGLTGLVGIPRTRRLNEAVTLVRPILGRTGREVAEYLEHVGIGYRQDDSNDDLVYTRNRIRQQLLPSLEKQFNRDVREAIIRLGAIAGEAVEFVSLHVERLESRCVTGIGTDSVQVDCAILFDQHPFLVRQLFASIWQRSSWPERDMGFDQWRRLAAMVLDSNEVSVSFPNGIVGRRTGQRLDLCRTANQIEDAAETS